MASDRIDHPLDESLEGPRPHNSRVAPLFTADGGAYVNDGELPVLAVFSSTANRGTLAALGNSPGDVARFRW